MAAIQGQGPGLCHSAMAGRPLLQLPCAGSLLLPGLIYSKDHLGPENNVFFSLSDLELVTPS